MQKYKVQFNTLEKALSFLESINYGDKTDYRKIYLNNSLATNWSRSLKVAAIAYFVAHNEWPSSVEWAGE